MCPVLMRRIPTMTPFSVEYGSRSNHVGLGGIVRALISLHVRERTGIMSFPGQFRPLLNITDERHVSIGNDPGPTVTEMIRGMSDRTL